jgi:hypothetical protein
MDMTMRFWLTGWVAWLLLGAAACPPLLAWQPPAVAVPPKAKAAAPMTDIHDIKPLVSVPVPGSIPRQVRFALLGLLGAAVLGAGGFYLWKKRRPGSGEMSPPPRPPEEVAREALEVLGADNQIGEKLFYFQLSAILRAYLEARFGLEAMEMTTEELAPALEHLEMERSLKSGIREFLVFSDPIKFADACPALPRRDRDIDFVRKLVEKTTARVAADEERKDEDLEATVP